MPESALIEQLDQAIDAMLADAKQTASADPTLSSLMEIAGKLRYLPDDAFKKRLSRELRSAQARQRAASKEAEFQRRTPMTAPTPIESTAAEFAAIHTVTPFICVPEAAK